MSDETQPLAKCSSCGTVEVAATLNADDLCELCVALDRLHVAMKAAYQRKRQYRDCASKDREDTAAIEHRQLPPSDR